MRLCDNSLTLDAELDPAPHTGKLHTLFIELYQLRLPLCEVSDPGWIRGKPLCLSSTSSAKQMQTPYTIVCGGKIVLVMLPCYLHQTPHWLFSMGGRNPGLKDERFVSRMCLVGKPVSLYSLLGRGRIHITR